MEFLKQDFDEFRQWLNLDFAGITWQGRYAEDFDLFWDIFFVEGLSLKQLSTRFKFTRSELKSGPLVSWFSWLETRLLIYTFIEKNQSIQEIAKKADKPMSEIALDLREYFLLNNPHLEDRISDIFQITNIMSPNINLRYTDLKKEVELGDASLLGHHSEVMTSMEITLYEEWRKFVRQMEKKLLHPKFDVRKIQRETSLKYQFRFVGELFLLLLLGVSLVFGVKVANNWYEKYLSDRISVYEPQIFWLDKTLSFRDKEVENTQVSRLEIRDIEQIEEEFVELDEEEERFETESEVVLSSWHSLPKNFDEAELEQSDYEELKKGGYRDIRFGNKKVFRVMMKAVDVKTAKNQLDKIMDKYTATQVDHVRPGTNVPGGAYYNLYVPVESLQSFFSDVMEVEDSILYESRNRGRILPGKSKVFIWVKQI